MNKVRHLAILSNSIAEHRGKLHYDGPETTVIRGAGGDDWACGQCEAILVTGSDNLPMLMNAAVRCNSCGSYNDLTKVWPFNQPPITAGNLGKLPEPVENFSASPLLVCPYDNQLNELGRALLAERAKSQGRRPEKLYHYTSSAGLHGIVSTGRLWASDVAYLNDSTEFELAVRLINEIVAEAVPNSSNVCKELLRRATGSESVLDRSHGYYVVCFCGNSDLLSQWRAYGAGGGGYAIGFAAHQFGVVGNVVVRRAIYDPLVQRRLVTSVVETVCNLLDEIASGKTVAELDSTKTLPAFSQLLGSHLLDFCLAFKHRAFSEEQEWRAIVPFFRHANLAETKFRDSRGTLIPYLESNLGSTTEHLPKLPIIEVIYGPTLHSQLTKKSLELLLERHDFGHVEILGSEAPLRA
ncbi:MAG: DUF2971 domain-containing protein [Sulfuritalea sp.]|nr:DUF2971 domain-containing protein [Sulfuritalea sp.]